MEPTPQVTSLEDVQRRSGYKAVQPPMRPPWWGVDADMARRPGVPRMWAEPHPWPNTRYPPEQQPGEPTVFTHGRPNKRMTPVFGTTCPLHGVSGAIRRFAYRYPDHYPRYWMLKLAADRVDVWERRVRNLAPLALPLVALGLAGRFMRG